MIDTELIRRLKQVPRASARAVASTLEKFNEIQAIDVESAMVAGRRALDCMLRTTCRLMLNEPGTKPLDSIISDLDRAKALPSVVAKHCRFIKDFGRDRKNFPRFEYLQSFLTAAKFARNNKDGAVTRRAL